MPKMDEKPRGTVETKPATEGAATVARNRNNRYNIYGLSRLEDYDANEILRDISLRIRDGRRLIVPIGLPQSGKSMFIASLVGFASGGGGYSCNFDENGTPADRTAVRGIEEALNNQTVLPTTAAGYFTIIDYNMRSNYRRNRMVRVTLIDFAGEDLARVMGRNPDWNENADKIQKILNACVAQRAIFPLISPIDVMMGEVGQVSDFDNEENACMTRFVQDLRNTNRNLYNMSKFLIILSKWDLVPGRVSPEYYLQKHRNGLYREYHGNLAYGLIPYSVGNVVAKTIVGINLQSAKNFWYTLYRWSTGKHVLPWWKRIFS